MAKILICGYGNIGSHVEKEFNIKNNIYIYDRYKNRDDRDLSPYFDAAFICVPTEMNEDGTVNTTEIFNVVPTIADKCGVVIIKSAVPIGTYKELGRSNVIISPEYYGTTQHSLDSPNFAILGGSAEAQEKAVQIYQTVKDGTFKFLFVSAETAELAKYMENCWIAAKVTFCNEFASIADAAGVSYAELRECFVADERVSPYHTFVYKDKPYFDSHCLNKDIPGLIKQADMLNVETPLMDKVLEIKESRSH